MTVEVPKQSTQDGDEPTQSQRAMRNTASLLISRVAVAIMGWAGTVIVARMLSPESWGEFSFIFGVLGLMSIVTDLGVGRVVLSRLVGTDDDEISRLASSFIALRILLGLIGYLIALGFVIASGYSAHVVYATAVAGIVVVIATPSHALTVLFQSQLKLTYVAAAEMLGQLAQLILTIVAALVAPWLIIFVIPAVANEVIGIIVKIRAVRKGHAGPRPAARLDVWRWKEMLREAVPLSIGFAFVQMASRIDIVMLAHLDTFDSVGLYSIGYKFADFVVIASVAVITPFMTLLVAAWPDATHAFRDAFHRASALTALICAVCLTTFWPVAHQVLGLLYGSRFEPAAYASRLQIAGAALTALSQLCLIALVSAGRHRIYPWIAFSALLVNVGLNLVLIPRFSYNGAAWASIISQILMLIALAVVVRVSIKIPRIVPAGAMLRALVLIAAVVCAAMYIPGVERLPWPVLAALSGLATLAGAHLLGLTLGFDLSGRIKGVFNRR